MGCHLAPSEIPPLPGLSSSLLVLFCTNICHQGSGWGSWGHHRCEACVSISACLARASAHMPPSCPSGSHVGVSNPQNVCASRVGTVQGCGGRVETVRPREGDRLGSFIHPTAKDWIRGGYPRPSRLCSGAWEQSSRHITVLGTLWRRRHCALQSMLCPVASRACGSHMGRDGVRKGTAHRASGRSWCRCTTSGRRCSLAGLGGRSRCTQARGWGLWGTVPGRKAELHKCPGQRGCHGGRGADPL